MILGRIYRWVKVNTAAIVELQDKTIVAPTTEDDYKSPQAYRGASRVYAGMFAGIIKWLTKNNMLYVIPRAELKTKTFSKGIDIEKFDGLSLSSINRPFSRLVVSSHEKCGIERWANPFALITDGTRNLNTFFYQMPIVKLSNNLLRLFHKSKLPIKGLGHELFGIPGITIFLDKTMPETNKLIQQITGLPISLEGDGIIVSKQWKSQIKVLTDLGEELDLPTTFKMQGLARSKGITIAEFEANRVLIRIGEQIFPVEVIMNTQGKRLNKAANITLSAMRLRKFLGEEIPTIDTANVQQLIELKNKYKYMTGTLIVDGEEVGKVLVGINKFYIDLTHKMQPKVDSPNISYVQAKQILKAIDYPLLDRFPEKKIDENLKFIEKQIDQVTQIINAINHEEGGDFNDNEDIMS